MQTISFCFLNLLSSLHCIRKQVLVVEVMQWYHQGSRDVRRATFLKKILSPVARMEERGRKQETKMKKYDGVFLH